MIIFYVAHLLRERVSPRWRTATFGGWARWHLGLVRALGFASLEPNTGALWRAGHEVLGTGKFSKACCLTLYLNCSHLLIAVMLKAIPGIFLSGVFLVGVFLKGTLTQK